MGTILRHKWTAKERKTICSLTRTRSEEINISVVNFRSRLTFVEVCDVSKIYNSKDHYWLHTILYVIKLMKIGPNSIQIIDDIYYVELFQYQLKMLEMLAKTNRNKEYIYRTPLIRLQEFWSVMFNSFVCGHLDI